MAKDLLAKAKALNSERVVEPHPNNIFSRNELPNKNLDIKNIEKKRQHQKTTTIRCSTETALTINTLVAVLDYRNVTELLDKLTFTAIDEMTPEEKIEYKTIRNVLARKPK